MVNMYAYLRSLRWLRSRRRRKEKQVCCGRKISIALRTTIRALYWVYKLIWIFFCAKRVILLKKILIKKYIFQKIFSLVILECHLWKISPLGPRSNHFNILDFFKRPEPFRICRKANRRREQGLAKTAGGARSSTFAFSCSFWPHYMPHYTRLIPPHAEQERACSPLVFGQTIMEKIHKAWHSIFSSRLPFNCYFNFKLEAAIENVAMKKRA